MPQQRTKKYVVCFGGRIVSLFCVFVRAPTLTKALTKGRDSDGPKHGLIAMDIPT